MSRDEREAEDVAGLFRKFGGDAKGYKEFEPAAELGRPAAAWTLIPGSPGAPAAPAAAVAPPAPPAVAPEPAAATAAAVPLSPAPASSAVTAAPSGTPRELDLLFARLAGQPQPAPEGGHGLMSRWRKPT